MPHFFDDSGEPAPSPSTPILLAQPGVIRGIGRLMRRQVSERLPVSVNVPATIAENHALLPIQLRLE
jgi:hypothetical protein